MDLHLNLEDSFQHAFIVDIFSSIVLSKVIFYSATVKYKRGSPC